MGGVWFIKKTNYDVWPADPLNMDTKQQFLKLSQICSLFRCDTLADNPSPALYGMPQCCQGGIKIPQLVLRDKAI